MSQNNDNKKFKQGKQVKPLKVIEIHNELSSLREKLDNTERLNDYLSKQIAIHHVKQGNLDSLLDMAQTINLRKEELDNYKEKLTKIHNLNGSFK